jgi:hypothetical protein
MFSFFVNYKNKKDLKISQYVYLYKMEIIIDQLNLLRTIYCVMLSDNKKIITDKKQYITKVVNYATSEEHITYDRYIIDDIKDTLIILCCCGEPSNICDFTFLKSKIKMLRRMYLPKFMRQCLIKYSDYQQDMIENFHMDGIYRILKVIHNDTNINLTSFEKRYLKIAFKSYEAGLI